MARGRPKTAARYVERVGVLTEEGLKPLEIFKLLENEATHDEPKRGDYPSERTVRRLVTAHKELPLEEQRQQALFTWPAGIEKGALPWEAGQAALELLRYLDHWGRGRPTVRIVKWFYRLRLAAPTYPIDRAFADAAFLAYDEFADASGTRPRVGLPGLEWRLAYQPWASPENDREHDQAAERYGFSPYRSTVRSIKIMVGDDLGQLFGAFAPKSARQQRDKREPEDEQNESKPEVEGRKAPEPEQQERTEQ
jgi:hypothetical protein